MSDWRPIKTSPKDGTWVLLTGGKMDEGVWYGGTPEPPSVVAFFYGRRDISMGVLDVEAWGFADWDGACRSFYLYPTHWMPLPAPPPDRGERQ